MFDFKQPTNCVLNAIEKIYRVTKDSSLQEEKLSKCMDSITRVSDFLGCTAEQAVIMAIIIHINITKDQFSIKGLLNHADLGTPEALYINEVLAPLVEKDWINPKKDPKLYPLTEYFINSRIIRSVLAGKMEAITEEKIDNSFKLLIRFQSKLNDRNLRKITYDQFIDYTYQMITDHPQIELADFILQQQMKKDDSAYFMYACLQHYLGDEKCDFDTIITEILPSKEQQYHLRNAIKSGEHYLLKNELLKEVVRNDFFSGVSYQLTEKAIHAFDKNAVVVHKMKEGLLKHVEPESITERKLIFDTTEQKLVNKLHDMLEKDNFGKLTEKLQGQGMKKGISVLLYGHPGTGKTETVLQLGKKSNRYIMMADASKIRSKWVGETEKNMRGLFDEYRQCMKDCPHTPVLLFNEADAILGKRHAVNDRGDQMENAMQNILLEELENFEGIFIATTNMVVNLDKAFERRFLYKIRFDKPGEKTLLQIWKSKFPDIKTGVLKKIVAKIQLTGGQIENIRKKITVDSLLEDNLKLNERYLLQLAEQEILLENKSERRAIGFIQ